MKVYSGNLRETLRVLQNRSRGSEEILLGQLRFMRKVTKILSVLQNRSRGSEEILLGQLRFMRREDLCINLIHKEGGPLYIRGEFQLLKMYKMRWLR